MNFIKKKITLLIIVFINTNSVYAFDGTVFIDIDYILNNSNYGKSIILDLEKLKKKNTEKITINEKNIKLKKDTINKNKNILSEDKLKEDIDNFNKEVKKYQTEKKNLLIDFDKEKKNKLEKFLKEINPIIQEFMAENSIDIVLEKKQIFVGNSDNDITNDILKLINKNL
ncbi:OmpH family outer membrane protein [Candidatus Pelagibacter communis]|uniref:OmpH family outer membrane protein n=1 Tax=Pelagibacter ubique TaxID=198252 RepID=UPI00094C4660|nr:OmpH family outer membrane protein [Candidatus Pelagibacter ubique]